MPNDGLADDVVSLLGARGADEVVLYLRRSATSTPGMDYDAALGADIENAVTITGAIAQALLNMGARMG